MIFMKIHIHKEYFTIYIEKAINWYRDYKVIKLLTIYSSVVLYRLELYGMKKLGFGVKGTWV